MMRQVERPQSKFRYAMRSIASGGERLGQEMLEWGRQTFGFTINEFYGQTEANLTVSQLRVDHAAQGRLDGTTHSRTRSGDRG